MKTIYGKLDYYCERYKWTFDYVFNEIPFPVLNRMMADMPWTADKGEPKTEPVIDVSNNPEKLLKMINGIQK